MKKGKYFTVHMSVTIRGQAYRNGVCYTMPESLRGTIEDMAGKGTATIFEEPVRIISGRPYSMNGVQKQGQDERAVSAPSPSSFGTGSVPGSAPVLIPGKFPDKLGRTTVRRPKRDFN